MPYKSKSQQRALERKCGMREIDPKVCKEFREATKRQSGGFKALPDRAKGKK